jgi:hypothetical protein
MIWYLIRKYFIIAVVSTFALSVLPLIMGRMSVQDAVPSAILWSALVTPIVTSRSSNGPHNMRMHSEDPVIEFQDVNAGLTVLRRPAAGVPCLVQPLHCLRG